MSNSNQLKYSNSIIIYPLFFVLLIWVVFWVETVFGFNFNSYGIYPRRVEGLRGILFSPFIHGSLKHLFNNSVPLFVLTMALFYFYRIIRWKVLLFGLLLTGIATWCIGRSSLHIGASGVVYMLAAFLFFQGNFFKAVSAYGACFGRCIFIRRNALVCVPYKPRNFVGRPSFRIFCWDFPCLFFQRKSYGK